MTTLQALATVGVVVLGTMTTRFLPFLLFPNNKKRPGFVSFLGSVLPYSVMGLLIVYCLKDVQVTSFPFGIPEAVAILAVAGLHIWKKNMLLSIAGGTVLYMLLVQLVFS